MIKIALSNSSQHLIDTLMDVLPYDVIWVAYDSTETIKKAEIEPPDLIILDVQLPGIGALEVTKKIISELKCAIILTTTDIGLNSSDIFELMGHGALDVISLKRYHFDEDPLLVNHLLNKIQTIENLLGKGNYKKSKKVTDVVISDGINSRMDLVVIGASTGGPVAISKIISTFPVNASFSVVIIQHIDQLFIPSLVAWLNDYSKLPVEIAKEGGFLKPGTIYVAAKNEHLVINAVLQFEYIKTQSDNSFYYPSIDVFFESLAKYWKRPSIAVLLTGMGNDGANGLKKLYDKKWFTIVQDEESCIVFGMPKMAIHIGAVCDVLPIDKIGQKILKFINSPNVL